jgi:hypothetical protein
MSLLGSERALALRILGQLVDAPGAGRASIQLARGLIAIVHGDSPVPSAHRP